MASKYQASRGTFDVLPEQARRRARVERAAAAIFARAGYEPIATPAFEDTELFERGVGRSTDIVRKEMFTFEDKGERSLTLRPEGTAPICRAYLEHGMHKLAQPVKLSYVGPFFRHERPQAGRYRQFHQLGIECIGTDSPLADAEAIMLLSDLLGELGVPGVRAAAGQPRLARGPARLPGGAEGAPARPRGRALRRRARADRRQPAARLRLRSTRGRAAVMASAPTIVGLARGRGRRALRRGAGPARRGRHRLRGRPDPGPRPRLLHADDLLLRLRRARRPVGDRRRRPLRRPDRAARRAADAGGRLGGGNRADPAGAG